MSKVFFEPIELNDHQKVEKTNESGFPQTRRELINWIRSYFDRSLLAFQVFYFFFYAAFGSLFPLVSIYFKQLGLSAIQCGILSGIRSFVECLANPFWNALAEKWKKGKTFLIVSLICSMSFTLGLGFVRPTPQGCLVSFLRYQNQSEAMFETKLTIIHPYPIVKHREFKSVDMTRDLAMNVKNHIGQSPLYLNTKILTKTPKTDLNTYGQTEEAAIYSYPAYRDYTQSTPGSLVMPLYSTVVYNQTKINQIFILIILLVLFGELLSCPAIPLVDALVAQTTQVQPTTLYGQHRIAGSVGWSLAMFFIGLALDNSSVFPDYPCLQPGYRERNYMVCFATYSVFLACALLTATQFRFVYEGSQESMYFKLMKDRMTKTFLGKTIKSGAKLVNEDEGEEGEFMGGHEAGKTLDGTASNEEILERQLGIKIATADPGKAKEKKVKPDFVEENNWATASLKLTKWGKAMRQFCKPQLLAFLFVTWFMGLGVGQVFTFLFWHMQELDGSPTLFGIATIINHISEIAMFAFSKQIIARIGHLKILYLGLCCNVARFLYVSWIRNPWWILPFEFLQGLTHAGVWVACCSYITQAFAPDLRPTTQGFLKGVHYGLGRGLGACFGGLVIGSFGSAAMFRAYGAASAVVLVCFLLLNYVMPIPTAEEIIPEVTADGLDSAAAASYGEPLNKQAVQFGGGLQSTTEVTHDYYKQQEFTKGTPSLI